MTTQLSPTIERLDLGDEPAARAAAALVGRELGPAREARLAARAVTPHACFVSRDHDGTVTGVLSARIADARDTALVARLVSGSGHVVGIVDDLVVDPGSRGRGVAGALLTHGLRHLATEGCTLALTEVWRSGRYESFGLVTRAGFETVAHVGGYWSTASTDPETGWDCPTCGRPCRCPATLMLRSLR